ncbi:hypothetical protein CN378_09805 [Bacillus sp. AFS015802]|uniref:hypothetical protein n=1 Tax=Bacillus sp. AFS015802 TaxID=2033486 RepID=UPI000BF7B7FC|nr:hypothetical protein [Bacillus sp. AFS015802]PFA67805.1 hypothetical protein CN378_09805 [Bacillus sp. AFS015802]
MSEIYTDYTNKTSITIPDNFIEVKTGDTLTVSDYIQSQIEYHTANNTLSHLLFSALNHYFHSKHLKNDQTNEILKELTNIKKMIRDESFMQKEKSKDYTPGRHQEEADEWNMEEIEDLLEAFGG